MRIASSFTHSRLTLGAWTVLILILAYNLFSLSLLMVRFTLPTDGWLSTEPDDFDGSGYVYRQNIIGLPSALQPDDWLTNVNSFTLNNGLATVPDELADAWQAGNTVQYTVQRGAQTLTMEIPLANWRIGQFFQATIIHDMAAIFSWVGLLVFSGISFLAFWQRAGNPAAMALFVLAGLFLGLSVTLDVLPFTVADMMNPWVSWSEGIIVLSAFSILLPPALIRLGLVFPHPKPILAQHPWIAIIPYLIGAVVLVLFSRQVYVAGWIWTGAAVIVTIILLLHNAFTMRDAVSRGQMQWALWGTIIGLGLFSLSYIEAFFVESSAIQLRLILQAVSSVGIAVVGIAIAVAILRYHLFDLDLIVNRALVYGGLTLGVVSIYILVVGYLGFLFQTEADLTISLVATGMVAVLFAPLRNLLQRGVNRLMYGQRDEPYAVLTQLGRRLETTLDPSSALSLTVETVANALKLPYSAIALQQEDRLQIVATYGTEQNEVNRFPLVYAAQTIGELIAAPRSPHETFNPADLRLLHDLARQIGITAHAVLLSATLEQARLRLVTERGEARRQLGSDLHDGVGHQLVGLTRQVESVLKKSADNPIPADGLLINIDQQLIALTKHVRSLAHQLFPPELQLMGLVGALRERAQTDARLNCQIDAPERLPSIPAEFEAAAYYIAMEALTNIDKHAQAQECHIRLRLSSNPSMLQSSVLEMDIRDDGSGLPPGMVNGLGLLSMQARAVEVGGTCSVEPDPGGGTAVIVRIPCPAMME